MSLLPARRLTARAPFVLAGLLLFALAESCGGDDSHRKVPPGAGGTGGASGAAGKGGSAGSAGTGPGGEAGAPAAGGVGGADEPGGSAGEASGGEAGNGGAGGEPSGPLRAFSVTAGFWISFVVEVGAGQVWSWGNQVDALTGGFNDGNEAGWATAPVRLQGLTGVDQVVAVSETSSFYAHHVDGTVSAWGRNTQGQLGDQTTTDRPMPVKVQDIDGTPMRGVCSIAAGAGLMIMARAPQCSSYPVGSEPPDTIKGAWVVGQFIPGTIGGTNAAGYPSNGAIARQFPGLPVGVEIASIAMPDASASTSGAVLFLMDNGSRYAWGYNSNNKLGAGVSTPFAGDATTAVDVTSFWPGVVRVELGRTSAIALNGTGTLSGVGGNLEGQLGTGNDFGSSTLGPVLNLTNVTAFSVGQVDVVAITSGQLWAWGWDGLGPVTTPTRLGALDGFTQVSLGDDHGLAIGPDQRVYVWGGRTYGALGDGILSGRASTPALLAE